MGASAWRAVRWLVALGLCALLVVLAVPAAINALRSSVEIEEPEPRAADPGDALEPSDPTGPVGDGGAAADTDLAVHDGTVRQGDAARIEVTGNAADSGIVASFDLVDGDPSCVASLELAVDVVEATPGELAVYPSGVTDTDELADGETVEGLTLDESPRALALSDGRPGRLVWDLTELYQQWTQDLTPPGTDLAVVIRPRQESQRVRVASVESEESAGPRLAWTGEQGCG